MPSIDRPLDGDVLHFDLAAERAATDPALLARSGRIARTLAKSDALRVTLVTLAPGGEIAEHHAEGPITVHCIDGAMDFTANGTVYALRAGELLSVGAGVRHTVASQAGATFLLTLAAHAA